MDHTVDRANDSWDGRVDTGTIQSVDWQGSQIASDIIDSVVLREKGYSQEFGQGPSGKIGIGRDWH